MAAEPVRLEDGDTCVLTLREPMSAEALSRIAAQLREALPGRRTLILEAGMTLTATDEAHTTDLVGCARCHGDGHEALTFLPLTHPMELDAEPAFTHWAPCPSTGEPILLRFTEPELTEDERSFLADPNEG